MEIVPVYRGNEMVLPITGVNAVMDGEGNNLPMIFAKKDATTSDAWDPDITYTTGQYCLDNNTLWRCLIQNENTKPEEGTYWTRETIGNNLVTTDGEGNRGYLKADGSFSPFSSKKAPNFNCTLTFSEILTISSWSYGGNVSFNITCEDGVVALESGSKFAGRSDYWSKTYSGGYTSVNSTSISNGDFEGQNWIMVIKNTIYPQGTNGDGTAGVYNTTIICIDGQITIIPTSASLRSGLSNRVGTYNMGNSHSIQLVSFRWG